MLEFVDDEMELLQEKELKGSSEVGGKGLITFVNLYQFIHALIKLMMN